MKFIYSSGQRVLDGYTLKRGIGQGGFGEVYYAVSDGGKEVALKLVRGNNLDVELRGMAQCLNLKHPNLLTLYDLRTDCHGDHWVVMEYIAGESLSAVLNRHPQGLDPELARQWFLQLARAVGHLHDNGIVHRDLKPGNVFLENGAVKVGDYGLCKFMSSSQRTAQTQSVGTVHYMAPEISTGNYNKQIDIYAAGVMLFEMLTGRLPFDGESAGEILMKHLTSTPDLSAVPREYVPILQKALAKDPRQRYASMAEFAQAVEAVGQDADCPEVVVARGPSHAPPEPLREAEPATLPLRGKIGELCGSMVLSALLAALCCIVWARLQNVDRFVEVGSAFFLTVAACWAILLPAKFWREGATEAGARRFAMLVLGMLVGAGALWLDGWQLEPSTFVSPDDPGGPTLRDASEFSGLPAAAGYLSYFGATLFALRWWKLVERRRAQRFSLLPVLAAAFWALLLMPVLWPTLQQSPRGPLAVILAAAIVQLASPWEQPPAPAARRVKLRYA